MNPLWVERVYVAMKDQGDIPVEKAGALPNGPGVYRFLGQQGALLYVGKSIHIRKRVATHLRGVSDDLPTDRQARLRKQIHRIQWQRTAGELGALLLEAREIKSRSPIFNKRLRRSRGLCLCLLDPNPESPRPLELRRAESPDGIPADRIVGLFHNRHHARQQLQALARNHQLCPQIMGLSNDQTGRPCFQHQLGRCLGACCGKESLAEHYGRLRQSLKQSQSAIWPWPGTALFHEEHEGRQAIHVIRHWCHLGTAETVKAARRLAENHRIGQGDFDLDLFRILTGFLHRQGDQLEIDML